MSKVSKMSSKIAGFLVIAALIALTAIPVTAQVSNTAIPATAQIPIEEAPESVQRPKEQPHAVELHFFLVMASDNDSFLDKWQKTVGTNDKSIPENVRMALKDIASLTRYKGFVLIDDPFLRTATNSNKSYMSGQSNGVKYELGLNYISVIEYSREHRLLEISRFDISVTENVNKYLIGLVPASGGNDGSVYKISAPIFIPEGQVIVLGASKTADNNTLITIVTAKIL